MALKLNRLALIPFLAIAAGSLVACDAFLSPLSPDETRALSEAEDRWAARPFQSYSVETRVGCFCPPILNEWTRVEVVNGSVARVVVLDTGTEVSAEERAYFQTVEQLFDGIRQASREDWVEDITVEFDHELGYPTLISFDPKDGILDAGSTRRMRNARAMP